MPKFRKLPVVIEAFQFTPAHKAQTALWPNWAIHELLYRYRDDRDGMSVFIRTLEGEMEVSENDYVIQGVNGEVYPCKPDIFEKTYEPVED